MLAEARYLREMTKTNEFDEFLEDPTLRRATERSLEILGEAAKAVPPAVRRRWPDLPWSDMARMRDLLAHASTRVDPAILWKTAEEDAASLVGALTASIEGEEKRAGSGSK